MSSDSDSHSDGEGEVNFNSYCVESVERADPPKGIVGDDWYRYIIARGKMQITGLKPGSLQAVTEHAEVTVEDLNSRLSRNSSTNYVPKKR